MTEILHASAPAPRSRPSRPVATRPAGATRLAARTPADVRAVQRAAGNRAVQTLLAPKPQPAPAPPAAGAIAVQRCGPAAPGLRLGDQPGTRARRRTPRR